MNSEGVPLVDVLAGWAYSEVSDGHASRYYGDGAATAALRAKRTGGIPFDQLSASERLDLTCLCRAVRRNLMPYLDRTDLFHVTEISRAALADMLVPPSVWHPQSAGRIVPFSAYIDTPCDDPNDARNVVLRHETYEASTDPVTVGHRDHRGPALVDGYHRAALFWRFAPVGETLRAHMPRSLG